MTKRIRWIGIAATIALAGWAAPRAGAGDAAALTAADVEVADLDGALESLAARFPDRASIEVVGRSREGRPILALRVGARDRDAAVAPPALVVVAGLDGRRDAPSAIALGIARARLAEEPTSAGTLYVVPRLNPDAAARRRAGTQPAGFGGSLVPFDDDHDGRVDEDGPRDVDGDGRVTWMRVFDPPPGMARTHLADPEDPRLSRPADRARGERPEFAWLREGEDRDGDGEVAEDGAGGVSFDRNFPARFPENTRDAGPFALSEPENRALVDWALAHDDIAAAIVLGDSDNVVKPPSSGEVDVTGRTPRGLDAADAPYHEAVGRWYAEVVGREDVARSDGDGALVTWLYTQYGVPTFALDVSGAAADPVVTGAVARSEEEPGESGPPGGAGAAAGVRPATGGAEPPRPRSAEEKAELAWLAATAGDAPAFVPFREVRHPTLGRVSIGGPLEAGRLDPPRAAWPDLATRHAAFAARVLDGLPRVSIDEPTASSLGAGVHRIRVEVRNDGFLPSLSAMGERTRRALPVTLRLEGPEESIVSGARIQRAGAVPGSGGTFAAEWTLLGAPGEVVRITVRGSGVREHSLEVTLRDEKRTEEDLR